MNIQSETSKLKRNYASAKFASTLREADQMNKSVYEVKPTSSTGASNRDEFCHKRDAHINEHKMHRF